MFHLRTFGSIRLTRDDGGSIEGVASQRRMLALLSILAVAGEEGVSRERIISLLWPDGDSERGRSSLSQSVYSARKLLRCDSLFRTRGDVLGLNPTYIGSDVGAFLLAIEAGRQEDAAYHYTGEFLDDFHVPGLADFDHWLESQRSRLREAAQSVFTVLAKDAENDGDWRRAVEWRRRQASIQPYDGVAAHRLAAALRNAGDRAAALSHLRTYAALLRADLEVDPDPAIVALTEELSQAPPPAKLPEVIEVPAVGGLEVPALPSVPIRSRARGRRRLAAVGAVCALATTVGAFLWYPRGAAQRTQDTIVAPFRLSGADASLGFLKEGLVDMLASRLDGSGYGSMDVVTGRDAWRSAGIETADERSNRALAQIAGRIGARRMLVGTVIGNQRHAIITASVVDAVSQNAIGTASVEGSLDSLSAMVDRLAGELLLLEAGEQRQFSMSALPRLPALRAYLKGQSAYQRGAYLAAMREYERSVAADSTFALAALQLALAADRLNMFEQQERAVTLAWSNRAQLTLADRRRLIAFVGPKFPAPSSRQEQRAAIEEALRSSRDRVDMLVEFAQRYVRMGAVLGINDAGARAQALVARALKVKPDDEWARSIQSLLTIVRVPDSGRGRPARSGLPPALRWRVAVEASDDAELAAIRTRLQDLGDEQLIQIARMSLFDAVGVSDGTRALSAWESHARGEVDQVGTILAQHAVAMNSGDPQRALQLTRSLAEALPGSRAHLRLRVLDALYGSGDGAAAEAASARLASSMTKLDEPTSEAERIARVADACVAAQWRLSRGQVDGVGGVISHLRSALPARANATVATNPQACAELLEAWLAVERNSPGALARLDHVDSLVLAGPTAGDAAAYAPILISRLYERLGHPRRALDAIGHRPYLAGWPRYLATIRRQEQVLLASLKDQPSAEGEHADPPARPAFTSTSSTARLEGQPYHP